ncbi:MAG TPA: YdeI/OmpD-associated family protein [Candidatus Limnocylindrales bacterium]|nr:YdeI/OmpD-associated family protein [Candidatus Limnocylindrales bacterium]
MPPHRIRALLETTGKTAVGFEVPEETVLALGKGKRPPVRVTINGYTYRSTVAPMGGRYLIGVSAENRAGAGVAGGETHDIELEIDDAPREVALPADFAAALDAEPAARRTFEALSPSNKGYHVTLLEGAKSEETRARRLAKSIAALREGKPR